MPRLIATLVSRRREVKKLMKDKTATPEQLATWDIKQLALKLTANSMYGCLGYTKSRFYARPLAVLTTFKGREILRSTKELAESKALQVIYGDTDSVMINANVENVTDALKVGNDFKRAVNERYRLLEIDIDNVFRRILLQAKKKYAAVNMVETAPGKWVEKLEVKGLDMKRREYCALSKDVSSHILNEILSGDDTEAAVRRIHEYLRETVAKMRDLAITSSKYIIFTQLGKHPKEYPNADSMPQVQVALRDLARGKTVRRGDVVSYIVTTGNPDAATADMKSTSSDSVALRAYSPPDVLRPNSGLVPDVEWYVAKQIFPPVERLCANITGTSTTQLAEALGLDIRRYATNNSSSGSSYGPQDLEIHPLDSQLPDALRFRDCTPLTLRCRACKTPFRFLGLADPTPHQGLDVVRPTGLVCPSESCGAPIPHLTAVCLVDRACRTAAATYYEGWTCCEDAACPAGGRTRQVGVLGNRCLGGVRWPKVGATDCGGKVRYEVSEKAAYTQLLYLSTLFDVDRARARAKETSSQRQIDGEVPLTEEQRDRVLALAEHNRARFTALKAVVDRYLDKCGRQWVAMDTLFAKLGFAAA